MVRWQPNPSERLAQAALELFAERGYENTTVIDIAQRAGLTKSTFFRHFQDKREVLFGGGAMNGLVTEAIAAAPAAATPLEAVGHKRWAMPWTRSEEQPSRPHAVNSAPAGGP
jgi:AcrR family transcriptional regulator